MTADKQDTAEIWATVVLMASCTVTFGVTSKVWPQSSIYMCIASFWAGYYFRWKQQRFNRSEGNHD
jgi:hypothetical protein